MSRSVVFIFLDGVGIGADDPARNPFLTARLPVLRGLLDGGIPTLSRPLVKTGRALAFPLDAGLGIPGRPQSGTGQTALLTGHNAATKFGRHFGPWTPTTLRPLLASENVLVRARAEGRSVAFANAYPRGFLASVPTRRQAAPPLAALAADCLTRHHEHLARGEAIASGILNTGWREQLGFRGLPEVTAAQAGLHLAGISEAFDLTFFAHYDTDRAGHAATVSAANAALERVDAFLGGVIEGLGRDTLLLVASDHGNVEELDGRHTMNPVLGLIASGGGTLPPLGTTRSILDVAGLILEWLG